MGFLLYVILYLAVCSAYQDLSGNLEGSISIQAQQSISEDSNQPERSIHQQKYEEPTKANLQLQAQGTQIGSDIQNYLVGYSQEALQHYPHAPLQQQFYHPSSRLAYFSAYPKVNPGYAERNVMSVPLERRALNHWSAQEQQEQQHPFPLDAQINEVWKSKNPSASLLVKQLSTETDDKQNLKSDQYHSYGARDESGLEDTLENNMGGHVKVKVYPPPSVKDVQEEENLDDQTGVPQDVRSKSSDMWKEESKKSPWPQPVQQTFNHLPSVSSAQTEKSIKSLPLQQEVKENEKKNSFNDVYFVAIVAGCSAAAIFGVIAAGYCFYKIQKSSKAVAEVDYPAYGVTGPSKEHTTSPNGDRKLAQSAQMYHYQHQKQQMIAVEKASTVRHTSTSDVDSEEENEEGDYTVYECPGLAPTGEMEVKNPLFNDDSTPVSPPVITSKVTEK